MIDLNRKMCTFTLKLKISMKNIKMIGCVMSLKSIVVSGLLLLASGAMADEKVSLHERVTMGERESYTYQTVWKAYEGFNRVFLEAKGVAPSVFRRMNR